MEREDRWVTATHPQGVLPENWNGTMLNRAAIYMILKDTSKDRHTILSFTMMNFVGLDLTQPRSGGIRNSKSSKKGS
ncbi:hypothetical protein TNCV_5059371 [Trichonephila clavipes]|nr:hypothetical protein TNCV_5059371 [Trichonephila clavipes]